MNAIRNAGNYVSSKTKRSAREASKEANKQVAKDPNVRTSTRLHAAGDAMKDKIHATGHKREADVHKNAAKHNY
ncbi:hypothetical protein PV11_03212 [Exophiala sideris]|uniref:Glucose-repressible protein n=1 Tax=Exophiala sideris TaxID=1016849 RepID=A0A0D1XHM2_9EURO|nr:hypothetical protein PV11_03212 [Exophiala sideris]